LTTNEKSFKINNKEVKVKRILIAGLIGLSVIGNSFAWSFAWGTDDDIALLRKQNEILEKKLNDTNFLAKETAYSLIQLKNAFEEVNKQFIKQNEIDRELYQKIQELQKEVDSLKNERNQLIQIIQQTQQRKQISEDKEVHSDKPSKYQIVVTKRVSSCKYKIEKFFGIRPLITKEGRMSILAIEFNTYDEAKSFNDKFKSIGCGGFIKKEK